MKVKVIALMCVISSMFSQMAFAQIQWQVSGLGVEWAIPSDNNVGILKVSLSNVPTDVCLTSLTVQSGNTSDLDVSNVMLYRDNGDGIFNADVDQLIAGGLQFSNGCVSFDNLSIPPKSNGDLEVFIAYDIADFDCSSNFNQVDGYFDAGDIILSNGISNSSIENPAGSVTLINEVNVRMDPGAIYYNLVGSHKTVEIKVDQIEGMKGAHFICEYDTSKLEIQQVQKGSIWPSSEVFFDNRQVDKTVVIDLSYLDGTVSGSGILATINFVRKKPGTAYLKLSTVDLRDNLNRTFPFTVEITNGISDFLLGDFRGGTDDPDGKVNFEDLVVFASAYGLQSGQEGWNPVYDIGPTNTGRIDGAPKQDNVVNFEDLSLFALNYGAKVNSAVKDYDLMFKVDKNDGTDFEITLLLKRNNTNWDKLGTSNFVFTYNSDALSNPTLQTAYNFSGGNYSVMGIELIAPNSVSLNIDQVGVNNGTDVTVGWMEVATVHFDIINEDSSSNFNWDIENTLAYDDNETTQLYHGTFKDIYVSLSAHITNPTVPTEQDMGDIPLFVSKKHHESIEKSVSLTLIRDTNESNDNQIVKYDLMLNSGAVNIRGFETVLSFNPELMKLIDFKEEKSHFNTFFNKIVHQNMGTADISWVILGKDESSCKNIKIGELYFKKIGYGSNLIKFNSTDVRNKANEKLSCLCEVSDSKLDESKKILPETISLSSNYPNPFNPSTHFSVQVAKESIVNLNVFNIIGQKVKTLHSGLLEAGIHNFTWDGRDEQGKEMETGVYLYILSSNGHKEIRKMTLLR